MSFKFDQIILVVILVLYHFCDSAYKICKSLEDTILHRLLYQLLVKNVNHALRYHMFLSF